MGAGGIHMSRTAWRIVLVGVILLCFVLVGMLSLQGLTGGGGTGADIATSTETSASMDQADVDRLRSLPYAAYSDEQADLSKTGVVNFDRNRSYPGRNLYVIRELCRAELLDETGRVLNSWEDPGYIFWQDCVLQPDGTFWVVGKKKPRQEPGDFYRRGVVVFSWDSSQRREIKLPVHHDVTVEPGKPVMVLQFRLRDIPEIHPSVPVLDNVIASLSEDGEILEEASLYDILSRSDQFEFLNVAPHEVNNFIDLFHANTIEWVGFDSKVADIYGSGNILVTMRHQDAVVIIDWKQKKLLWSWGQRHISGPHHASMLENGRILLFDNGIARGASRVIEVNPLSREIDWQYVGTRQRPLISITMGGTQRLPNGNTLITASNRGRVIEVTPRGEIVWEFRTPHMNDQDHRFNIERMKRYPIDYLHDDP